MEAHRLLATARQYPCDLLFGVLSCPDHDLPSESPLGLHPPLERQMVIVNKNEHDNGRSSDTYYFEFSVDGEPFELEVGLVEYFLYDEGDTYTFKEYKGAFGKPFYARG